MLLCIDPGLNNCGLSIIDDKDDFLVKKTVLVKNARKFTEEERVIETKYGSRTVKVKAIVKDIENLLLEFPDIHTVIMEAPFYNKAMPNAFGSLLEVIFSVKYMVVVPKDLGFAKVEPLLVKKFFSKQHLASKQVIKEALIKNVQLGYVKLAEGLDVEKMSEHEIDSIAVGYSYRSVLEDPNRQLSK